jgi:hypothetical protein
MTELGLPAAGNCRSCSAPLKETFADLGVQPLANSYISATASNSMEPFYPLHVYVCSRCYLVQLREVQGAEKIFGDYLYFSSFSESWLQHAENYVEMIVERLQLGQGTHVVEVASNDGYLLQHFRKFDIPVLGIEPAFNVANAAIEKGIPTEIAFFGTETACRVRSNRPRPSLIIANNVLAHVEDLHDFMQGFRDLLAPGGVVTMEFPHVLCLLGGNQFDTIYHEHLSYFSLLALEQLLCQHGLVLFDVEELSTHGGSLRIYLRHSEDLSKPFSTSVSAVKQREIEAGLANLETYRAFSEGIAKTKLALLEFLVGANKAGKRVVGYGAPAKGNTLLNYCGVGRELLAFTVDRSPHKQGHLLPGTRIPIRHPDALLDAKPHFVLILPWNLRVEISEQLRLIRDWGGRFVVPIPRVEIF